MLKLISCIFLSIFSCVTFAKDVNLKSVKWKLFEEKNGIQVYEPKHFEHESGIIPIKFRTIVKHNIRKVLSVLADNERKNEWIPRYKSSKIIEEISPYESYAFYRYTSPWPLDDRTFLLHQKATVSEDNKLLQVRLQSTKHAKDPKPKNTVRGTTFDGYSRLEAIDEDHTELEMAFMNDFGGSVPSFVVNFVQRRWPYEFMRNIKKQLAKRDIKISPKFAK